MLRFQRFIELSMRKPPPQAIADRRRRRAMKKASIKGDQSSYGTGCPREEKPAVDLAPPQPPSIVLRPDVPGRGNPDRMPPSLGVNANVISIENKGGGGGDVLTEARGSCSKVGKKRKISGLQKAEENFKRMKAEVEKKRAETNQMRHVLMEETTKLQATAEGMESALAQDWAQNELMVVQHMQDQYLLMLGWRFILDADDI